MKIISQTADEMVLKDTGGFADFILNIILFSIFVGVGGFFVYAYFFLLPVPGFPKDSVSIILGSILIVAGSWSFIFTKHNSVFVDKARNKIFLSKKSLVRKILNEYNISDVAKVELRKTWRQQYGSPYGNQNQGLNFTSQSNQVLNVGLFLILKDASESLLFSTIRTLTNGINVNGVIIPVGVQNKESLVAKQFADFLNVPFQEVAPPSIGMGIGVAVDSIGKILN